jgi:hypothetical protein
VSDAGAQQKNPFRESTWRTGGSLGRSIYAQISPEASKSDQFMGLMETPQIAERVVREHNAALQR